MFLNETWFQRKSWERIRKWLPKGYVCEVQEVGRRNRKGRTIGGMITGCREELKRKGDGERGMGEGLMSGKVCLGEDWWRLTGVYVNNDLEGK